MPSVNTNRWPFNWPVYAPVIPSNRFAVTVELKLVVTPDMPSVNTNRWPFNWPVNVAVVPVRSPVKAPVTPSNRFAVTLPL